MMQLVGGWEKDRRRQGCERKKEGESHDKGQASEWKKDEREKETEKRDE